MSGTPESTTPAHPLPSGAVTFVFTDIEGSTKRWEGDRAAMQDAVRRHDALVRQAIVSHGGYVFKTVGDAFCSAFARPEDAVACAAEIERVVANEDFVSVGGLRVRCAIHTGTADERDGDYFGPAVNRVARMLAIGHGGQILVSGIVADLVRDDLPPETRLRDLGAHRLRDLTRPETIFQVLAPGIDEAFAPLRSLDALPNNLPASRTSFVGREREVDEIARLIGEHRLVTIVGSGGVGKTRASLHVAAQLLDGFPDGAWFIELAPLASGEYIPTTIALVMGLTLRAEADPVASLVGALRGMRALLVFDNCEHIVESAATVVSRILTGAPKLSVLTSSRQALGLAGEATYRMPSLAETASVALFVERALAADSGFTVMDETAPVIADICRRLDGIPLAIELAAARVKMLAPRQLRDHLDERFRVLTGGSRDVLPRQQTLRAMIDWSYNLLDDAERSLFRRLGIFVNGFSLESAVAVCGGNGLNDPDVFDLLASLIDKSLVMAESSGNMARYRLLESTRAYALEKLGTDRDRLAGRKLIYLCEFFAAVSRRSEESGSESEFAAALQAELEDVRGAINGAGNSQTIDAAELIALIAPTFRAIGLDGEGIRYCETILAGLGDAEPQLLARIETGLSFLVLHDGRKTIAVAIARSAVEHARASGDRRVLANALTNRALVEATALSFDEAASVLAEAESLPDPSAALRIALLEARASLCAHRGDLEEAAAIRERLSHEHHALGNTRRELITIGHLAEIEHGRGRTREAVAIVREMLPAVRRESDKVMLEVLLGNLASYEAALDNVREAREAATEAIAMNVAGERDTAKVANAIEILAMVSAICGDVERSAVLEGWAEAAFQRHGSSRELTERMTFDRLSNLLNERLTSNELARLMQEGAVTATEAIVALALEQPVEE